MSTTPGKNKPKGRKGGKSEGQKKSGFKPRFSSRKKSNAPKPANEGLIRLNKYLADAGICSRREADKYIETGAVKVNGKVVTELGTKVSLTDKVQYGGETLRREKLRYFLLNKPKGFITTSKDPQERKTVMLLMENACNERIYPVGRLDKDTMGLLMFTNDGELAKKLTHPKNLIKKTYHVYLDKNISAEDLKKIEDGFKLEDGFVKPDAVSRIKGEADHKQIGIELHSGKNRIVRRIFAHLGYNVVKLDRVFFAGLTKKDLPRGKFRQLERQEINLLKRL